MRQVNFHRPSSLAQSAEKTECSTSRLFCRAGLMLTPSGKDDMTVDMASHTRLRPNGRANIHVKASLSR
jgi:hypothetical protein